MTKLIKTKTTADAIFDGVKSREGQSKGRAHLGASLIGDSCARKLWYTFRWCDVKEFAPRILRLFRRGHLEEMQLVEDMRAGGVAIWETNAQGQQFKVNAVNGHFGGSMDGIGLGLPESPEKYHLLEFKTSGDKYFKKLVKEGVEAAQPKHFAQMQCYMYLSGETDADRLTRAMYVVVNKNDDSIYSERVKYHGPTAKRLIEKADMIINSPEPPIGVSKDSSWYECKFCDFSDICHGTKLPRPSCRTCAHSTPVEEKKWRCELHGNATAVCADHVYIPQLVNFAEVESMDEKANAIKYVMKDGRNFTNGTRRNGGAVYSSAELFDTPIDMLGDSTIDVLRIEFDGTISPSPIVSDDKHDPAFPLTEREPFNDKINF